MAGEVFTEDRTIPSGVADHIPVPGREDTTKQQDKRGKTKSEGFSPSHHIIVIKILTLAVR